MNPILKDILAVFTGLIVGSIVNMGIIMVSSDVIPPPSGGDSTTMEGLNATMHLFEPRHFIFPFLAHAIGTLVGAFIAARIASTRKMTMALVIGFFFLIGGISNVMMLPSPTWFIIVDLGLAYIPMALLGGKLGITRRKIPM
jgi:uncharacterized membrane protein YqgA involved in biofilm formation